MSALPKHRFTEQEYLDFERAAETKHEYYRGEILAMAGAQRNHNRIVGNTYASFHAQTRETSCEVFMNDMRVRISPSGRYVYPDVVVVCGEQQMLDDELDTLLNPTLVIEVLSETTEKYDRGEKAEDYRRLDSLQELVLIAQDKPHIERFTRKAGNVWEFVETDGLDATIDLPSIGCTLALADVYARVDFGAGEPGETL